MRSETRRREPRRRETRRHAVAAGLVGALVLAAIGLVAPAARAQSSDRFQKAIPRETVSELDAALALRRQGRDDEALRALVRIVRARPDYFRGWYNLGLAHLDRGDLQRASKDLERAKQIREEQKLPEFSVYSSLGWSYLLRGKHAAAETNLRIAWAHQKALPEPVRVQVLNNLGLAERNQGDYASARAWFAMAVERYASDEAREQLRLLDELEAQLRMQKPPSPPVQAMKKGG